MGDLCVYLHGMADELLYDYMGIFAFQLVPRGFCHLR